MKPIQKWTELILQKVQRARIAKNCNGHQHSNKVRDYSDGDGKALMNSV
jgi:hypothetical protein